jgi:penicillin-binding protein 2
MKQSRILFFYAVLVLAFLSLWARLFWLQIVKGRENQNLAEENRIKIIKTPAPRGVIYDINDHILARNRPEGREYVYGPTLAHVLGYVAEASREELCDTVGMQDIVGKMGVEKQYDEILRGKPGGILVEEDANGRVIREIKQIDPISGRSLKINIDLMLQQQAVKLLENKRGAIIATNPQTGAVLALASSPSFNPNAFCQPDLADQLEQIFQNPNQPMFNRAINGLYPPGSTFKIVTAIAGLEEEVIDKSTLVEDVGILKIGDYSFANWYFTQYNRTEGEVDILKAIQRSNDIYFYKTGEWLGITKLSDWAKYFGLEQPAGIDLPAEAGGLIPTSEWKRENKLEPWYLGDTIITSIGQGNLLLTPVQVNQMASVIAADGKLCQPHLFKEIVNHSENSYQDINKKDLPDFSDCQKLAIKAENLRLVKEGMRLACAEGGTGYPFFNFQPQVGCKTGTAEFGHPQDKTHAWFTVFAPWDNPEILVTVLLEEAGEGSAEAAPLAQKLLDWWFKPEKPAAETN